MGIGSDLTGGDDIAIIIFIAIIVSIIIVSTDVAAAVDRMRGRDDADSGDVVFATTAAAVVVVTVLAVVVVTVAATVTAGLVHTRDATGGEEDITGAAAAGVEADLTRDPATPIPTAVVHAVTIIPDVTVSTTVGATIFVAEINTKL